MKDFDLNRRDVLMSSLFAAFSLGVTKVLGSPLNPEQTIIRGPDKLEWKSSPDYPEKSVDRYMLTGDINSPGLYYTLVRWWPGYMSAPHTYTTDRFCMVLSGIWWCNSGPDFDPASCEPVEAGSFVRRVAGTPHYDGVIATGPEPAVIAICGMGPVNHKLVDPSKPSWRRAL